MQNTTSKPPPLTKAAEQDPFLLDDLWIDIAPTGASRHKAALHTIGNAVLLGGGACVARIEAPSVAEEYAIREWIETNQKLPISDSTKLVFERGICVISKLEQLS